MAINVNTMYEYVQEIVNQQQGSGYLSPKQFNSFANLAVQEKITQDRRVYQDTQKITDDLKTFIPKLNFATTDGILAYPSDYWYFIALRTYDLTDVDMSCPLDYTKLRQIPIIPIDSDKVAWRLQSKRLYQPTITKPIAEYIDIGIAIYPSAVSVVTLEYVRQPAAVAWGFTEDVNGLPVYDATTSVNFEHGMQCFNELMWKICGYFGIPIREQELIQDVELMQAKQG